jgi:hypothetical protein
VIKGQNWMRRQGWEIKDVYRNTTRPSMPEDETITGFGDRIIEVARRVISDNGGMILWNGGKISYRIRIQQPANVEKLADADEQLASLKPVLKPGIRAGLGDGATLEEQARAAYLAICLEMVEAIRSRHPEMWERALASLNKQPKMLDVVFNKSPGPAGDKLRSAAVAAGVTKPQQ